jgi:uncharacterized membrane protein YdjX (TVP38/TMEM64 family)
MDQATSPEAARPSGSPSRIKLLAGVVAVALVVAGLTFLDVQTALRDVLRWIADQGATGIVVFILVYVVACVLFIPGSLLTLGGGAIYGVAKGTLIVSTAATLGAVAAFLVGRFLARDWVAGKLADNARFRAIDDAVGREGWKIVGLTRLSPVFPFNLLNYAFGITKVSLRDYVLASWIGMLPGTLMYVYIGSLAGDLAGVGAGERERSTVEWAFYAAGLLATIVVTIYVTRIAKRALNEKLNE